MKMNADNLSISDEVERLEFSEEDFEFMARNKKTMEDKLYNSSLLT